MADVAILVVRFSDSFADLWPDLAGERGAELLVSDAASGEPTLSKVAVVILAAGGAERDAYEWLERHEFRSAPPVFAVGGDPGRRVTAKLVGQGAKDYFALPEDLELLRNAVSAAVKRRARKLDREALEPADPKIEAFSGIIGDSPALRTVLGRAARAIPHPDTTVLILGETGTGKELLAKGIHAGGPRRRAPFVPVNCSALPKHLVESELFGHERGAFTDAHAAKPGLFEVADGGTLFLDEIGTLPTDVQAKLLRVLEDKCIRRVGGTKLRTVDVRILAATNGNLLDDIDAGEFREDLFFRLSVITLTLPPLRARGKDVLLVTQWYLDKLARQHGMPAPSLTPEAHSALLAYHWPGNVRELRNGIERALLLSEDGELDVSELVPRTDRPAMIEGTIPFPAALDDIATAAAKSTLELCGGNRSEAARRLHISRRRLRRLLDEDQVSA